ncbi:hypothetical protein JCM10212_001025 [Sporobolomyces blumeae]
MGFATEHAYKPEPFTTQDLKISTLAFGFVLGFIVPCMSTAWSQTHKVSAYTIMIWGEIIVCFIFAVICWLYLIDIIPHTFAFFFSRVNLLWSDRRNQNRLKYGVAILITSINISVYCIWIPSRLQINHTYEVVNNIWDRVEKCIYLVVDAALNWLFMHTVNKRLVGQGLERYRPLVNFNRNLIAVSIACDCCIIGLMSYGNSFVYMSFHPVAYLIELKIELALGDLIVSISSAKPSRAPINAGFEGLKIAVSTHTTTTAVRFDDDDELNEKADPLRKTRTPARPDLSIRLEKMRRDRKARKEAENEPTVQVSQHGSDVGSEEDIKIDMDVEDSQGWESSVHHLSRQRTMDDRGGLDSKV